MPRSEGKRGIVACDFLGKGVLKGRRGEQDEGSLLYFASRDCGGL
jgi:hypothetical protein